MKVAELFWEPRRSGITGHVLGLARSLPRDRIDPFFLVPDHLADSRRELEAAGGRLVSLPLGSKLYPRAALAELPSLLRREAPSVLHLHALETGLWGHRAGRAARVPRIVFTPHTDTIRRRELWPVYLALWRRYGRATDVLLASTEAQRRRLMALGVAGRGRVLLGPGGVRVPDRPAPRDEASRRAARARLGWPLEGPLVGQIGRLVAQKDPLAVVRMAARLRTSGARVVLVGDGPLEAAARSLDAELGAKVLFAGYVSDLEPVYEALSVLVLASRWEGLSVVLLEALARGLAVVVAANEGNEAVVREGDTGRVVAPDDPEALARAASELLADPAAAARLGDRARALVLREHGERACAARIAEAYELARSAPPRRAARALAPWSALEAASTARVSVAIPTYRREAELLRCIEGLLACEPSPLEILVVDQTERHEAATALRLEEWAGAGVIRWIRHSPPSLTGARNRALREAKGDLVLFLDDEVEPPRELIALHARHFSDPTIAVTGGAVTEPGFPFDPYPFVIKITRAGRKLVNYEYPHATDAHGVCGANHMVRRDVAIAVGGYEENLSRAARAEDTEFCQRVLAAGRRVFYDPEARAVHRPAPRGGTRSQRSFVEYFRDYYHDDTFFFVRHVGTRWLLLFLARHVLSTFFAALGRRRREFPNFEPSLVKWPGILEAFGRGFVDALASARRTRRRERVDRARRRQALRAADHEGAAAPRPSPSSSRAIAPA
jgi:glycosyltransferase involved in cell wall biosynthesis/GT2 family glycosyltransferase